MKFVFYSHHYRSAIYLTYDRTPGNSGHILVIPIKVSGMEMSLYLCSVSKSLLDTFTDFFIFYPGFSLIIL